MAISGNGYTKTTWGYEERPVPSTKLNQWDDNIEAALELMFLILNQAWGGGEGIVRGGTANDLGVTPTSPVSMDVEVAPGLAFIGNMPYRRTSLVVMSGIVAPVTYERIDLIQAKLEDWSLEIKTGTEDVAPSAPGVDVDAIALAAIHLLPGMATIKNLDHSVNGYIEDLRTYI